MKKLCYIIAAVLITNLCVSPFATFSAESVTSTVQVVADADWEGNPSWQSATLEETNTAGTYILTNTDAGAGYSFCWTPLTGTISAYDKTTYTASMVVPGMVDGVKVTTIASGTFQKPVSAKYVVVSENITTLKNTSFRESGVMGVRLPSTLNTIEYNSFLGCTKLSDINLQDTALVNLGTTAFSSTALPSIIFPATLKSILRSTFDGCTSLESITFLGSLVNCNGVEKTSGNGAAFYSTPKLKTIYFLGDNAPKTVSGFACAGLDYQITVYYPQGAPGYETAAFYSGFRLGTTFVKNMRAQVDLQGKPNFGEKLTGSFSYTEAVENEQNSLCYWQRSDTTDFANAEKVGDDIYMKSSDVAHYTITDEDRGKYLRFYVNLPSASGQYTSDLSCVSEPTGCIESFTVALDVSGPVVGTRFYTAEGIGSYGAKATVTNTTGEAKEFHLISAWYSSDTNILVDLNIDRFSIAAGTDSQSGTTENTYEGTKKTPENIDRLELKLIAVESMSNLMPLTELKTYSGIYDVFQEILSANTGGQYTTDQISFIRDKVNQGLEPWKSAYDMLIQNADDWINEEPSPVVHLYVPGYYPHPKENAIVTQSLMLDVKSAYACGLAYQFTGKAKYAEQAIRILNAWSRTLVTIGSEDSVLAFAVKGSGIAMAAEFVKGYRGWSVEDKGHFDSWMKNIYMSFANKCGGTGNSGDWGILARVAGRAYLGDVDGMQKDISTLKYLITDYIAEDGSLPKENERGDNGIWYTYFALAPMTAACQIIYNTTGEDYFNWVAPNGRSVRQALNTFFYYCNHVDEWPYHPKPGFSSPLTGCTWPIPLWEAMGGVLNEQDYTNYAAPYRPVYGPIKSTGYHHFGWFYPTLMYGALQLGGGLPDYPTTAN